MKARISQKGKAILGNMHASRALVAAIVNNSNQLFNGEEISFKAYFREGDKKIEKVIMVRLVTAL